MSGESGGADTATARRPLDAVRVVVAGLVFTAMLLLALGPLRGVPGLLPSAQSAPSQQRGGAAASTVPGRATGAGTAPGSTTAAAPVTAPPSAPNLPLNLRQQTAWLPPEGGVWQATLALNGVEQSPDYELAVTVHQRVTNRVELARTMNGEGLLGQSRGGLFVTPLPSVPLTPTGELSVTIPTRGANAPYAPNTVLLSRPGIYPVSMEVRTVDEGRTVAQLVTHILALEPLAPGARLGVATVVGMDSTPLLDDRSGRSAPEGADELAALGKAVAQLPPGTVTLAPTGESAEALAGSPGAPLVAWEQAASRATVLNGPYVSVDPGSLGNRARVELPAQWQAGATAIEGTLRVRPDQSLLWVDRPTDPQTLAGLADRGTTKMLVGDDTLGAPPRGTVGNRRPFQLRLPGRDPVTGVAVDRARTDRLERPRSEPVQAVYHLLTDMAGEATLPEDADGARATGRDGTATGREASAVVLAPSRRTRLTPRAVTTLGAALTTSPVLRAVSVEEIFSYPPTQITERTRNGDVRSTGPLVRDLNAAPASPPVLEGPVTRARANWEVTEQVMTLSNRPYAKLILAAQSDRLPPGAGTRRLDAVTTELEAELAKVQLQRSSSLSLTATDGAIPVNVVNETGRTIRVRIELSSQKMDFPEGPSRTLDLDRRSTTVLVPVRARTSGNLPLTVVLTTADGKTELAASDEYRVRGTGLPGVGYALIGGALAVLALWWVRVIRRATRARREHGT